MGRFINADDVDFLGATGTIVSFNTFSYCDNDFVNSFDYSGNKIVALPYTGGCLDRIVYDVPLYKQYNWKLCRAFCQIMVESYYKNEKLSNWVASNRAIKLSIDKKGSWWIRTWNSGDWPTNIGNSLGIPSNISQLKNWLIIYGPLYGYYVHTDGGAHLIVITGVDAKNNIVYTNNPWGIKGEQSFNDFKKGFVEKKKGNSFITIKDYHLSKVYIAKR